MSAGRSGGGSRVGPSRRHPASLLQNRDASIVLLSHRDGPRLVRVPGRYRPLKVRPSLLLLLRVGRAAVASRVRLLVQVFLLSAGLILVQLLLGLRRKCERRERGLAASQRVRVNGWNLLAGAHRGARDLLKLRGPPSRPRRLFGALHCPAAGAARLPGDGLGAPRLACGRRDRKLRTLRRARLVLL